MKTMVLGASPRSYRYSHRAALELQQLGFEVILMGIHPGQIGGQSIENLRENPYISELHTITMYLNRVNQKFWYQYILDLAPKRVIFNPGSENPELYQLLTSSGIGYEEACTLIMLSTGSYQTE